MDNSSEAPPQPREAKLIAELLKNSGVEKYEPKVVNMLMEFAHRYLREVLQDCEDYRSHAGKSTIDLEDVAIALERQKSKWTRAPSREVRTTAPNRLHLPQFRFRAGYACSGRAKEQDAATSCAEQASASVLFSIKIAHFSRRAGVLLPSDKFCLTSQSYHVVSQTEVYEIQDEQHAAEAAAKQEKKRDREKMQIVSVSLFFVLSHSRFSQD